MQLSHRLVAFAIALACADTQAQTQAPGLWEHSFTIKSPDGELDRAQAQLQQQLAAMPADQRRQVEQMMASRGVAVGVNGSSVKVCITKEQATRPAEPHLRNGCTQEVVSRSNNSLKMKYQCSQPQPTRGEADMTFQSDKAYSGVSTATTEVGGTPRQVSMAISGRWLSADCGDVKPIAAR